MSAEAFFRTLARAPSPNSWLIAPADFPLRADAIAPVYEVPAARLGEAFGKVLAESGEAAVAEAFGDGMHIIATTPLLRFRDDVRVAFREHGPGRSTLVLYSASRVGYWDLGANRRRLERWLARLQSMLDARH